jgi:hypothetical protein
MFLATFGDNREYLVELVYSRYGTKVHCLLADASLAPRLLGTRILEGVPTTIVMEYLQPYSPESEDWATLFSVAQN